MQLQYAELLLSAGRPREAETRLNEILTTNPGLPEATRALAFLALTEQRLEAAKSSFNELRGDQRYRAEAFYYLGRIAETEKEFLNATRSYARVTDGTHAVEAQLRTARIMFAEQNDRDGAVRHLRDFGEANPRFASNMLVAQSQLLLQMQQPDEAMKLFDEALAATPDDPTLHAAHVQLYVLLAQDAVERGALDDADRLLAEGLNRYKGDGALRYSQALLYEDQGRNKKAVEVLEDLVSESPDDPALLNALGYLLTDQFERHEEARGYIQKALAMNPDSPAIIDSMGWVLYRLGDLRGALDYLGARVPARAGSGDRGAPRRRALGARRARASARVAAQLARQDAGRSAPARPPRSTGSVTSEKRSPGSRVLAPLLAAGCSCPQRLREPSAEREPSATAWVTSSAAHNFSPSSLGKCAAGSRSRPAAVRSKAAFAGSRPATRWTCWSAARSAPACCK